MKKVIHLLIPAALISILISGCYTQLYRPGMEQPNRGQQATLYNRYDSTAIDTSLRRDTTEYYETYPYPDYGWNSWGRPHPYGPIWGWDYYSPSYYWGYYGYDNYYGTPWWYQYDPYRPYYPGQGGGGMAEPPSKRGGQRSHSSGGGGSYVAPPPSNGSPTYVAPPPSSPPPQGGSSGNEGKKDDDNKRGGKRGH